MKKPSLLAARAMLGAVGPPVAAFPKCFSEMCQQWVSCCWECLPLAGPPKHLLRWGTSLVTGKRGEDRLCCSQTPILCKLNVCLQRDTLVSSWVHCLDHTCSRESTLCTPTPQHWWHWGVIATSSLPCSAKLFCCNTAEHKEKSVASRSCSYLKKVSHLKKSKQIKQRSLT